MAGYYEKTPSGKYRLFASGGVGPDGKRKRYTKTIEAKSDRQAEKLLAKFVAEVEKNEYVEPSKSTFEKFVERWIRDYAESNLAPKTLSSYKDMLKKYILPALGKLKVEQITPVHLMEFYTNLQEDGIRHDKKPGGLSPKSISYAHRIISSILQDATQWQVIGSNPCSRVKPPKVTKKQAACYDEEQTATMLAALETEELKYQSMLQLALFTGLRRGELMGLEWQDVDFDKKTLEIRQSSQYLPGKGVFTKSPKNESSERLLSLPPFLIDLLRQYRRQQSEDRLKVGDLWQGSDRLFTTWDGRPMHPDTPTRWFSKFIKKHGLPHLPFHGIRHTAATMLINQGLPAKSISGRLGHADIGTTMNIYGHYLKSADREAADRLEKAYQLMKNNSLKNIKKGQA
ncbi:MAG: putative prophage phiRv2 integrase [Pelotomaculum sp. PtaB.Bin104]|nr:MAG: putative prophage phiRv2 integrase [Pelotomaculum sp. PtaB.Bin104]